MVLPYKTSAETQNAPAQSVGSLGDTVISVTTDPKSGDVEYRISQQPAPPKISPPKAPKKGFLDNLKRSTKKEPTITEEYPPKVATPPGRPERPCPPVDPAPKSVSGRIAAHGLNRFDLGPGVASSSVFDSEVHSLSRLIDGHYGAPVLRAKSPNGAKVIWPVGNRPYTHKVAQVADMLINIMVPQDDKKVAVLIPTWFQDVEYGENAMLVTGTKSDKMAGTRLYQLFNGKFLLSTASDCFIRVVNCYGDGCSAYAVRSDFCYADAFKLVKDKKAVIVDNVIKEKELFFFATGVAVRAGRTPSFDFYTECFEWAETPEYEGSAAQVYLRQRMAERDSAHYEPEGDDLRPDYYFAGLMQLLEDNGTCTKAFRKHLEKMSDPDKFAAMQEVNDLIFSGSPDVIKSESGQCWAPVMDKEMDNESALTSPDQADGTLVLDVSLSEIQIPYVRLGEYPRVFASNALHIPNGSACLDIGLNVARSRQLAGHLKFAFIEAKARIPGSVHSLPTRNQKAKHGYGWHSGTWYEKGIFTLTYRGIYVEPNPNAGAEVAALCRALNNQLVLETARRGAQPGKIEVLSKAGLLPLRATHVLNKSHFLDSFSNAGGAALTRPFFRHEHEDAYGFTGAVGCNIAFNDSIRRVLRCPYTTLEMDSVSPDSNGVEAECILVIRTAGTIGRFPFRYEVDVRLIDPDATPAANYAAIIKGRADRISRTVVRVDDKQEKFVNQLTDSQSISSLSPLRVGGSLYPKIPPPTVLPPGYSYRGPSYELATGVDTYEFERARKFASLIPVAEVVQRPEFRRRGGRRGIQSYERSLISHGIPAEELREKLRNPTLSDGDASHTPLQAGLNLKMQLQQAQRVGEDDVARVIASFRQQAQRKRELHAKVSSLTWSAILTRLRMPVPDQESLEADLRDYILGYHSPLGYELLDPRVLLVFVLTGPMDSVRKRDRREQRLPSSLQTPDPKDPCPLIWALRPDSAEE